MAKVNDVSPCSRRLCDVDLRFFPLLVKESLPIECFFAGGLRQFLAVDEEFIGYFA